MNGGDPIESRDSAIKLFGKTITAPESHAPATTAANLDVGFRIPEKPQAPDVCSEISKVEAKDPHSEDCGNQPKSSVAEDGDEDKVLRKPDKIIACPRCDSMETKFCYFNNYNVNQPRHFCKNCQRYWTAGGTMRNVPVGAGRRKNKQFPSQYGQILVSSPNTPQATTIEVPDSTNLRPPSSVESSENTFGRIENREEPSSCVSSVASSSIHENKIPIPPQWYHPVVPWPLPVARDWNGGDPSMAGRCSSELSSVPSVANPNPVRWCTTQLVSVPGFSAPNMPLQFVPASYLGCLPVWKPLGASHEGRSLSSSTRNDCPGNNSPTLGKHSRGEVLSAEETREKCVSVAKIPRVDDSDEPSKRTLGFKPDESGTRFKYSMFRPFKSSGDCKDLGTDKTDVLEANPAALSRSHTFQEST